jgi:hypothetical protein
MSGIRIFEKLFEYMKISSYCIGEWSLCMVRRPGISKFTAYRYRGGFVAEPERRLCQVTESPRHLFRMFSATQCHAGLSDTAIELSSVGPE